MVAEVSVLVFVDFGIAPWLDFGCGDAFLQVVSVDVYQSQMGDDLVSVHVIVLWGN